MMLSLLLLALAVVFIVVATTRFQLHPFLALLAAGLLYFYVKNKLSATVAIAGVGVLVLVDLWSVDQRYLNNGDFERRVEANFFGQRQQLVTGATTLTLWLSTGFGTAAQQDQRITLRLSDARETVFVGAFEVK